MNGRLVIEAPDQVLPGELVEGTVRWQRPAAPESMQLRLVWRTAGAGQVDQRVVESVDVAGLPVLDPARALAEGPYRGVQAIDLLAPRPLAARDARRFRLRAPTAPPSFRGALVRLEWRLELEADGETASRRLVVSPTGRPIELP